MKKLCLPIAAIAGLIGASGCSSDNNPQPDGGITTTFTPPFTPSSQQIDKSIRVTFSGETFGVNGLPYPGSCPSGGGEALFFVDGWSVSFDEYLVVVDNIRLNAQAGNAVQTNVGALVATSKGGPWILDMHKPSGFVGADGEEPAGALYLFTGPDSGGSFDPATKYAFSYDVVQAKSGVVNVNLTDAQVNTELVQMISKGWTKFVKGKAVFAGTPGFPGGSADIDAKFKAFPTTVYFTFGWDDHDSAINCNNPDFNLQEDDPAGRGVQVTPTGAVTAQVTLHVDHIFWDQLIIHGTPLHFDQVAAWATAANSNPATPLALDQLGHPLAATFADGTPLPDRGPVQPTAGCYDSSFQPNPDQLTFHLTGSAGSVPATVVKNLADFMAFSGQSQMHLNADGLCYNTGQHAADPFYTPGLPK
jgi:hypothetical protein